MNKVEAAGRGEMKDKGSLVAFTLLAQAGIGLVLAAQLPGVSGSLAGMALRVALLLTGLGLVLAFAHLGRPFLAHRALRNLGSSPLSRECLALAAFLALGAARAAFGGPRSLDGLLAAAGCLGLFAMASLYGHAAFPAWKPAHTHVAFSTASLALGGFALAALAQGGPGRWALALAAGAVAVQLVETAAHLAGLGSGRAAQASLRLLARPPLVAGMTLTALGGLGYPVLAALAPGTGPAGPAFTLAFAALGSGQILVRYAFFASGVHPMAAGWADLPAAEPKRVLR